MIVNMAVVYIPRDTVDAKRIPNVILRMLFCRMYDLYYDIVRYSLREMCCLYV